MVEGVIYCLCPLRYHRLWLILVPDIEAGVVCRKLALRGCRKMVGPALLPGLSDAVRAGHLIKEF